MIEKLVAGNQSRAVRTDIDRVLAGGKPHYPIAEHIYLLSLRLDKIESADLAKARTP